MFKYQALRDDELIRELNAGEIDINFQGSKYAVYDNNTAKGLGVDLLLKKNKFKFRAFGSVTKGNSEVEIFRGNSSPGNIKLSEFQYVKGVYYQIEPLIRYNNNIDPPHPPDYALQPVNINPYGFEIYMDDQNPYNKQDAVELPVYGGFYARLQSGVDYKINYSTGLIQFHQGGAGQGAGLRRLHAPGQPRPTPMPFLPAIRGIPAVAFSEQDFRFPEIRVFAGGRSGHRAGPHAAGPVRGAVVLLCRRPVYPAE